MNNYYTLKNGGAKQAQPSGNGGGFFGWLGNLFSGIGSINIPNFNMPSFPLLPGGNGGNLQPVQLPNQQTQGINLLNNPIAVVGIVLVGLIIIKKINE